MPPIPLAPCWFRTPTAINGCQGHRFGAGRGGGVKGAGWAVMVILASLSLKGAEPSPEHQYAINRLEARRVYQLKQAAFWQARHDFSFSDEILSSGIAFEHGVVDDAALTYKAAHYDHGNGVAAADVDADGLPDLYWTTQDGSNQLWRNLGGGRFEDWTAQSGLACKDQISVAAAFADVDNDGDPDLFVTTVRHGNRLFLNQGNGRFVDATQSSGLNYVGHASGAIFFDYNLDGNLDLVVTYVGRYTDDSQGRGGFFHAYADAFSGHLFPERSEFTLLYQGRGDGTFAEVSAELGLRDNHWTGEVATADVNLDGYPDLYLVNMQGDDHFYLNVQGKGFEDRTMEFFPKTPWGAMGLNFFDANLDGRVDLMVTDMHSDMSQGQTLQALKFHPDSEKAKSESFCKLQWDETYLQGSGNNLFGNALYLSNAAGAYKEGSDAFNAETYWPWGASVGDLNADGAEDVFVAAGMGYPFRYGINSVLLNEDGKRFVDSEFVLGVEPRADGRTEKVWFTLQCDGPHRDHDQCQGHSGDRQVLGTLSTRSSVLLDLDNDGDLDIVTNEFNDRPQLLMSDLAEKGHLNRLKLRLVGSRSNRQGLGAKVELKLGERLFTRWHDGKSGYLAQSSLPLYFGLGDAQRVAEIKVRWPSGHEQTLTDVVANQTVIIREP